MMTKDLSGLDIDATLCISLKAREDRRTAMRESFKDSGLDIEFFIVDKDEEDPQRGCWNSHQACSRLALERGYKRILILEDDCVLSPFSPAASDRVNRFLKEKNPEIFYLGVLLGKIWLTWRRNIARCRGQGTHAYIISEEGCRKIINFGEYAKKGIDSVFSKSFKGYCIFPMICFQNDFFISDVQTFRDEVDKMKENFMERKFSQAPHLANDKRMQYIVAMKNLHKTLFFRE